MFTNTWTSFGVYHTVKKCVHQRSLPKATQLSAWSFILSILVFCCCTTSPAVSPRPQQQGAETQRVDPSSQSNDPGATGFFSGTPKGEQESWQLFLNDGQYRTAHADDFQLPEKAKQVRPSDLEEAVKRPYVGGDINHDGAFNDFAVIVVNTKRDDAERFGIVVFNQPVEGQGSYETHWLYHDRNLSSTILEWWSGGLAIREYHEDGSYDFCYVNWHPMKKTYSCDKASDR